MGPVDNELLETDVRGVWSCWQVRGK